MKSHFAFGFLLLTLAMILGACDSRHEPASSTPAAPASGGGGGATMPKKIVIGLVAKAQSNAFFDVAWAGAKQAAKDLGPKYNAEVVIDWQTPPHEDAQKQAEAIDQLAGAGAQGIAVACSDGNTVTPAIDRAAARGVAVVTFDSDAPRSRRLTYIGTDETTFGKTIMKELARVMDEKGTIAILAGNQTAPNLKMRREGVLEELKNHPDMKLIDDGMVFNKEVPEDAAEKLNTFQSTHPQIQGWAIIGGWPFFARDAVKWRPGEVKLVSADALPPQWPYLQSGHVETFFSQDPYGFGYKAVEILLEKVVSGQEPPPRVFGKLTRVGKDNLDEFKEEWNKQSGQ